MDAVNDACLPDLHFQTLGLVDMTDKRIGKNLHIARTRIWQSAGGAGRHALCRAGFRPANADK